MWRGHTHGQANVLLLQCLQLRLSRFGLLSPHALLGLLRCLQRRNFLYCTTVSSLQHRQRLLGGSSVALGCPSLSSRAACRSGHFRGVVGADRR
jgi:hypothetical protein